MRTIRKGNEPRSLTEYRSGQSSEVSHAYDDFSRKQELRESLCREQRGLCCYCMGRIRPNTHSMKIEHRRSQARFPEDQLNYSNLLGACLGGEGSPGERHCDTVKGHQEISINPADPAAKIEQRIRYRPNGTIYSEEQRLNRDLNIVLNLNTSFLKTNRQMTLRAFRTLNPGNLGRDRINRLLADWNGESDTGNLRPYCQVVVYWLQKRRGRT